MSDAYAPWMTDTGTGTDTYAPWVNPSTGTSAAAGGASNLGGMFGSFASAAGDIAGAIGDEAEAGAYRQAAVIAQNDAQISKASGAIQTYQMQRKINLATGGQMAEEGSSGFSMQGSTAQDIRRSSFAQGALSKQLIGVQTSINVNNYTQEANSARAMASAASAAAVGGFIGGAFQVAGGVADAFGV